MTTPASIVLTEGTVDATTPAAGKISVFAKTDNKLYTRNSAGTVSQLGGSGTVTDVTATSPVVSSGGATPDISLPAATSSVDGYLTSADWTTFNSKGSGTVTDVTATSPVVSSGGATPDISLPAATSSVDGYLTSADWTTFNSKGSGTVTSVTVDGTSGNITSSGSAITGSGTITLDLATTAVSAGSYTSADITVDAYGRVTAAANGSGGGGTPGGSNTEVQFNDSGAFGASPKFAWDDANGKVLLGTNNVNIPPTSVSAYGFVNANTATLGVNPAGLQLTAGSNTLQATSGYLDVFFSGYSYSGMLVLVGNGTSTYTTDISVDGATPITVAIIGNGTTYTVSDLVADFAAALSGVATVTQGTGYSGALLHIVSLSTGVTSTVTYTDGANALIANIQVDYGGWQTTTTGGGDGAATSAGFGGQVQVLSGSATDATGLNGGSANFIVSGPGSGDGSTFVSSSLAAYADTTSVPAGFGGLGGTIATSGFSVGTGSVSPTTVTGALTTLYAGGATADPAGSAVVVPGVTYELGGGSWDGSTLVKGKHRFSTDSIERLTIDGDGVINVGANDTNTSLLTFCGLPDMGLTATGNGLNPGTTSTLTINGGSGDATAGTFGGTVYVSGGNVNDVDGGYAGSGSVSAGTAYATSTYPFDLASGGVNSNDGGTFDITNRIMNGGQCIFTAGIGRSRTGSGPQYTGYGGAAFMSGGVADYTSTLATGGDLNFRAGRARKRTFSPNVTTDRWGGEVNLTGSTYDWTLDTFTTGEVQLKTDSTERLVLESDGGWRVDGTVGTAGQVLTSNGAGATPTWTTPAYGYFLDTATQTASANTPTAVTYNTTSLANDISIVSSSRVTLAVTGTYNFSYDLQVSNSSTGVDSLTVWFRKNGSDIAYSAGQTDVPTKHGAVNGRTVISTSQMFAVAAGDYIQIFWTTDGGNSSLTEYAAGTSPTHPESPSVMLTVTKVV